MIFFIVIIPFFSFLASGFLGKVLGKKGSMGISTLLLFISACFSFYFLIVIGFYKETFYIILSNWIGIEALNIHWGFLFDSLTIIMCFVVTFISTLVHLYSCGYMSEDPHIPRFMSYLSLFTFFMLILVSADNFLQLFVGWEGVGLCSYLLINFWFTRLQANKAALKALIINRVGDFAFVLGLLLLFDLFQSLDFSIVFSLVPYFIKKKICVFGINFNCINVICFFLFIGCMSKSAQIGLHTWLPDAMEGPTPVSALIHAATMVTAGVFLLIRCSPLFEFSPKVLFFVAIIGSITAIFASLVGLVQNDVKKTIAYSTCSQLGYMVFSCGLSNYIGGGFHLVNHAFFKALLFLSAGALIHSMGGDQDMRKYGGLINMLPLTYVMFLIGSLALVGFPFFSGFYSKDMLLESAFFSRSSFVYNLGVLATFFTSFYSFRVIFLTFFGDSNSYKVSLNQIHNTPLTMWVPLILLFFGSIFFGYFSKEIFIGLGSTFFDNSIFILPINSNINYEFIPSILIKLLPLIFTCTGGILVYTINFLLDSYFLVLFKEKKNQTSFIYVTLNKFLSFKGYFDYIYSSFLVKNLLIYFYIYIFKIIDKGILELVGPYGVSRLILFYSRKFYRFHTGNLYQYLLIMVLGFFLYLFLLIISIN